MSKMAKFIYSFEDYDGTAKELCYSMDLPYKDDPKELFHRIVATELGPIRRYLDNTGECIREAYPGMH